MEWAFGLANSVSKLVIKPLDAAATYFLGKNQRPINNVLARLNQPFVPSKQPNFGPVFPRVTWKKDFLDKTKLSKGIYRAYYGASGLGKTLAIQHALAEQRGVIYLTLRDATEENLPELFCKAIGYYGDRTDLPKVSFVNARYIFKDAVQQYKKKTGTKVTVFTDDFHKCTTEKGTFFPKSEELASFFLELYSDGLINNVYSVSDYQAIEQLTNLSGHSSRLSATIFPSIPDKELKQSLLELVQESKVEDGKKVFSWYFWKKKEALVPNLLFNNDQDKVDYIVKHLDSHMEELSLLLQAIVEEKKQVEEAVDLIVQAGIPNLASTLFGESRGNVDEKTFILTAWSLLLELEKENLVSVPWSIVLEKFPDLSDSMIKKSVDQLVSNNILSYLDWDHVCLHRRSLKYAFMKRKLVQRKNFEILGGKLSDEKVSE